MNDHQRALAWSWLGPLVFGFVVAQWFTMVSPGIDGLLGLPVVPGKNAASKAYWGALLGGAGLAALGWLVKEWGKAQPPDAPRWHLIPRFLPLEGDDSQPRSQTIAKIGLTAFIVVPAISVIVLACWTLTAPLVRWSSESTAREGGFPLTLKNTLVDGGLLIDRLSSIVEKCAYWKLQCYRIGNIDGIEYKPVLTDILLLMVLLMAGALLIRLAALLIRRR